MRIASPILSLTSVMLLCVSDVRPQYDGPESVEYDAAGDRYFISNTGDNTIKQRDQAGTVTPFVSVSPAPYGLEIQGDTLFACSGGSVKGYLLSTGAMVFNLNLGGTFLNGIASDGTHLYVTDFNDEAIYRVNVAANSFITWVSNTIGTPNGIVYDPLNDALAVGFWGSNAAVRAYDRTSATMVWNTVTGVTNIDGITVDCLGNYVISSWSPDRITRFEAFVLSPFFEDQFVPGLNNPADIDFDEVHGRVCIPNSGNDSVTLFALADCSVGISDRMNDQELRVIPNPTDAVVRIAVELRDAVSFILLDGRGLLIGGGTLPASGLLDISGLASGSYVIDLPAIGKRARIVKE